MLVAGVDCSTQATKVLIVDADDGTIVATGRAPHEVRGSGGARETHPDVWVDALTASLDRTGRARQVAAIAVAGQQHGLVVLDGTGAPLRPATLWNDTRSAPDAAALVSRWGAERWANQTGSVPVASFTATSWAWLRRTEPDVAAATRGIRLPHDYLTERLAERAVTDRGDASGTGWWSPATGSYVRDVLGLPEIHLDPGMLPAVHGPRQAAGTVTAAAAQAFGLASGTTVGPGTGDNMGAALGLGLRAGTPVISLGTSGTAYAVSTEPFADASGTVAGFADATGRFLPLTATLNCTLAVDRVATWLGINRDAAAADTDVVVLPYLDGERTPNLPNAAGTIAGLRHATEPGEILLAAYRGAAVSLLEALEAIDLGGSGLQPDAPIVLIGGGAQGVTWQRVVSRLSGRSLLIPDAAELVALGAAVQAAAIAGGEELADVADRWQTTAGATVPAQARDEAALERIRAVRAATAQLNAADG